VGKKPKDEMLPALTGVQLDRNDPTYCLVGLRTVEGVKSFTLHAEGARLLIKALQAFIESRG